MVDISFKNKKTQGIFESGESLKKEYGKITGRLIQRRMTFLRAAPTLSDVPHRPPERRHQLEGKRKGEFAVDLDHPRRLTFRPAHNPLPKNDDGGLDLSQITAIEVLAVEDYH